MRFGISNNLLGDADAAGIWRPVGGKIVRFLRPALPGHLNQGVGLEERVPPFPIQIQSWNYPIITELGPHEGKRLRVTNGSLKPPFFGGLSDKESQVKLRSTVRIFAWLNFVRGFLLLYNCVIISGFFFFFLDVFSEFDKAYHF